MSDVQSSSSSDDDADYHTCDEDDDADYQACDEDDEQESGDPRAASPSSSSSDDGRDWVDYHHSSDDEEEEELDVLGAAAPVLTVKKETRQFYTRSVTGLDQMVHDVLCEEGERNTQLVPTSGSQQAGDTLAAATGGISRAGFSGTLIQMNVNLTKQQFGDVTVEKASQVNQSFGGRQNISKTATFHEERKYSTPSRADVIHNRTVNRFKTWNEGMVKTAALDKVLEKLTKCTTWLTIKGNPGEGKTTVGHMALEELHKLGRQVFEVRSPDEFTEVISTCSRPVVMLDDVFGNLEFDHSKWSNWEPVLSPILKEREHKSHVNEVDQSNKEVTVIITGRDYVLNSASVDFLTAEKYVVCMDHNVRRSTEEKRALWEAISTLSGVDLDKTTVDEILTIDVPHGFPHVCRLFVTIFKEDSTISVAEFFRKPLEFLNLSVSKFFKDENKVGLFKEMMKGGGEVSMRKLGELDPTYKIKQAAKTLVGSYLKCVDDSFSFDHPSIYDSVAFYMCSWEPEFVIKHCDLSFIHERVRLKLSHNSRSAASSESNLVVYVEPTYADDLAERFAAEIMKRNIAQVLSHQAFTDAAFVSKAMSKITTPLRRLFHSTDQGYCSSLTFLSFVPSNKSPELLEYIDNCPETELTEDDEVHVLHGTYRYAASQVLIYLVSTRRSLDINKRFELGRSKTPLMIAAQTRDSQFVHQILSLNPDLDVRDLAEKTVLHYFCENGLVSAVAHVIESGADINAKDRFGLSPLCEACTSNQLEVVKLLIKGGAKIHETSLHAAAYSGNIKLVELLWEKETTLKDKIILNRCLSGAVQGNNVEIMMLFLDKGASVNTSDSNMFPLHVASVFNKPQALHWLLEHGAHIDKADNRGDTALHMAVDYGYKKCVDVLLTENASVDLQNMDSNTPLHNAIWRESEECVHLLVRKGASVNIQDKEDNTTLHIVAGFGSTEYADMLPDPCFAYSIDKHGKSTLQKPARIRVKERVTRLLESGADVNIPNKDGNTALHHAVSQCGNRIPDEAVCKMLIQKGAGINIQNKDGDTPLHLLCRSQLDSKYIKTSIQNWLSAHYRKLAKLLISNSVDVNVQNTKGNTALHNAVLRQSEECVQLLVKQGASVNIKDKGGNTSLHILAKLGLSKCLNRFQMEATGVFKLENDHKTILQKSAKILVMLLKGGADVNITNNDRNTALHDAVSPCFPIIPDVAVCRMLIQHGADVNMQNRDGDTSLHLLHRSQPGVESVNSVIRSWLTDHDKRIIKDWVTSHYQNLERMLKDSGADVVILNKKGQKALE